MSNAEDWLRLDLQIARERSDNLESIIRRILDAEAEGRAARAEAKLWIREQD